MSRGTHGGVARLLRSRAGEPATDRELLSAVAAGDPADAFGRLVERHGPMVYGVCKRVLKNPADADDAFQATFLVLAKKARAGGWHDSVANWLYGVAYRTAVRSRTRSARRRFHEEQATPAVAAPPDDRVSLHELRGVLDEEIQRLPEKFRLPVLLCCLHDRTIEEAAATLGLPPTTVKGRLQMGRDALRDRLTARGITLGAGVLVAVAAGGSAAGVPPALVQSTVSLAAAGTSSGPVAALANQEIGMVFWKKVRAASCVVGVLAAVAGGGVLTMTTSTAAPVRPDSPAADNRGTASAPVEKDGLEVTARPTKAVFRTGEPIEIEMTYTNRGKAAISIDVSFAKDNIKYWTIDTKGVYRWRSFDYNKTEYQKSRPNVASSLPPGGSVVQAYRVEGQFTFAGLQDRPVNPREFLPAGEYTAGCTVILPHLKLAAGDPPLWTGTIEPKPVTFRVGDTPDEIPASEPAVKDGLEVTARPTKAVFRPGETIEFDVTYTNRRKQPLTLPLLPGGNMPHWKFYWFSSAAIDAAPTGAATGRAARVSVSAKAEDFGKQEPQLVELAAGRSITRRSEMRSPFSSGPPAPGGGWKVLSPGVCEAWCEVTLPVVKWGGRDLPPLWTGSISLNRVRFRIGDGPDTPTASDPAVKDGLAVTVRPTKPTFGPDERPQFDVTFTNRSDKMTGIWTVPPAISHWSFRPADGSGTWQTGPTENGSPSIFRLDPAGAGFARAAATFRSDVRAPLVWNGKGADAVRDRQVLPPGRYTAVLHVNFQRERRGRDATPDFPRWLGNFDANPVPFVVADKAPSDRPAPIVVTEDLSGKAIAAKVGQTIEVRLDSKKKLDGWEGGAVAAGGALVALADRPTFQPAPNALDEGVGTSVFAYTATAAGTVELRMNLLNPSGPTVTGRDGKPAPTRTFAVTIEVAK